MRRPLLLSTRQQAFDAAKFAELAELRVAGHFADATMHTPIEVTYRAMELLRSSSADGVISFGGGSTVGLGKALVHRLGVTHLAIPTTYAGSEMTPILGQTDASGKTTITARELIPSFVIYDVELTLGLPRQASVTSGLNALAHAIEAMYSPGANPVLNLIADEAVRSMAKPIGAFAEGRLNDLTDRSDAQYASWLCAICLAQGGVALHHKLCHVLGGTFNLPHAETHAIVLPYALAFNAGSIPKVMDRLEKAIGTEPIAWLRALLLDHGLPSSLAELGMPKDGIAEAARLALAKPYPNPRALDEIALVETLSAAWLGEAPR